MFSVISGNVVEGKKLGRKLGFPTANIELTNAERVQNGIYAVEVEFDGLPYFGVANIGISPTINDGTIRLLEVYIFGMSQDIYGEFLKVKLITKLRDECKFGDVEELRKQIVIDADNAKKYFKL